MEGLKEGSFKYFWKIRLIARIEWAQGESGHDCSDPESWEILQRPRWQDSGTGEYGAGEGIKGIAGVGQGGISKNSQVSGVSRLV